jgi:hypothetical protein
MADFDAHPLLTTDTVAVWDVVCPGTCKHKSAEECVAATHLVFHYRGVCVHHVRPCRGRRGGQPSRLHQ